MSIGTGGTAPTLARWVQGQDGARIGRYAELLAFYNGAQWQGRPRYGERRVTYNYARTFVRKVVSYLFAGSVNWAVPTEAAGANRHQATEEALTEVAEANDLGRVDFDTALDAAVLGDGAFKITWDAERAGRARVVIRPVDVQGLYCWWAPDDRQRLERVVHAYRVYSSPDVAAYGGDSVRAGGQIWVEDWRPDRLIVERGGERIRDEPNPYPWLPFLVFPNEALPGEFWGISDLHDLMPICREVNRRLSTLGQVLDLSGAPIAVLENVEGSEGIAVEPGAKWELPEKAKAYLLDLLSGGGVRLHIEAIEALYRTMHDIAETPRTAFGEGEGAASGVALEHELQPLIQKVKRKRAIWDGVFRRRNAMVLDLLTGFSGEHHPTRRTRTVWPPITPRDRPQQIRDEVSLVQAGIHSRQLAAEQLGDENPAAMLDQIVEEARRLNEV